MPDTPDTPTPQSPNPDANPPPPSGEDLHNAPTSFLPPGSPASNTLVTTPEPSAASRAETMRASLLIGERAGETIGPYRLLQPLGEGGFGVVWLAERREPIVQRVALKVIKPGMDTRSVIARFEQERQALAVMDHPSVAKVLDAGATSAGRPYFVMEYVQGEPINTFCDRHNLSIRERLHVFLPVCEAVQHAHTKGIIHRDLKPSNILVAIPDGPAEGAVARATPKVIDFGVAKAINHVLTDKTLFTELGQIVGTPEYMSPEQAGSGRIDIDTRTDVYSLGAVLYELLTGALPFDPRTLRSAGYAEIQRIIREVDPPRPSTRLSDLGKLGSEIARRRKSRLDQLEAQLRRELEWIPLKAMRKNRDERYLTPSQLAQDIRNYLDSRPLIAGPESSAYRARKFVRKHRIGVIAGSIVAASLIAASVISTIALVAERRARREAVVQRDTAQAVNDFVNDDLLSAADPEGEALSSGAGKGIDTRVVDVLGLAADKLDKRFADRPAVQARVARTLGAAFIAVGDPKRAEELLRRARRLAPAGDADLDADLSLNLSEALFRQEHYDESIAVVTPAIDDAARAFGPTDVRTVNLRHMLASALKHAGKLDQAQALYEQILAIRTGPVAPDPKGAFVTRKNLALIELERGNVLKRAGKPDEARAKFSQALDLFRSVIADGSALLGPAHPEVLAARSETPKLLVWTRQFDQARAEFDAVIPALSATLGPTHWRTLDCRAVQANMLRALGDHDAAAQNLRTLLDDYRVVRGPAFRDTITVTTWLMESLEKLDRFAEVEALGQRAEADLLASGERDRHIAFCCRLRDYYQRRGDAQLTQKYAAICAQSGP